VAYAKHGSHDNIDVGNWGNQNEDYDEEKADNEVGADDAKKDVNNSENAGVNVKIAAGSKTSKSTKKMNRKKFVCCRKCTCIWRPGTRTGRSSCCCAHW
jgi:hypothetical protein